MQPRSPRSQHSLRFVAWLFLALCSLIAGSNIAQAGALLFDGSWKEQGFFRLWSNRYEQQGNRLDITSNGTVSLLWRQAPEASRLATAAEWNWQGEQGVEATDLSKKGGDDRNLAIYFVFVDTKSAANLTTTSARSLLRNPNMRALVYVWGGAHPVGAILPSPYHRGLRTKVLRTTPIGAFDESVNLEQDYRAAFGTAPGALAGLAISADSDDTGGRIRASVGNFTLQ